ncbi:hypothetical protein [Streptomyces sp. NPDC002044]|uniref:hypothetical protein n=1 Tax=Streptomyces sp. NPDC002044 TaxID=3154662 RepID=UPI00332838F5
MTEPLTSKAPTPQAPTSGADGGTRTGALMRDLRRTALFRSLLPMEANIAWPIPLRRPDGDGRSAVFLRFALFAGDRDPSGRGVLVRPPFATLTVARRTGRIVEYADLRFTRPWPATVADAPVGRFPGEGLPATVGEYKQLRHRLLTRYDELLDALDTGRSLPAEAARDFSELLGLLVEPGLEPYLRALGPGFFTRFLGPGPSAADQPDRR